MPLVVVVVVVAVVVVVVVLASVVVVASLSRQPIPRGCYQHASDITIEPSESQTTLRFKKFRRLRRAMLGKHASDIITEPSESQQHFASKIFAACGGRCWASKERYEESLKPTCF